MAAKPLDIWRTPSSTHWQCPPKRIVHRVHLMGANSRNELCGHKYLRRWTESGEQRMELTSSHPIEQNPPRRLQLLHQIKVAEIPRQQRAPVPSGGHEQQGIIHQPSALTF